MTITPVDILMEQVQHEIFVDLAYTWPGHEITPEYLTAYKDFLNLVEEKIILRTQPLEGWVCPPYYQERIVRIKRWIEDERKAINDLQAMHLAQAGAFLINKGAG